MNEVDVYPARTNNPPPRRRIVTGLDAPTGMAVDGAGNAYVCNNAGQSSPAKSVYWTVTVYARGQSTPFRTYTDGVFSPVDVAVASDATVYIANFSSAVTVYPPGSLHPGRTLRAPSGYAPLGVAVDASGNVFVSYVPKLGNGGLIYKYKPARTRGVNLGILFNGSPHGLAVDSAGNLIVAVSNAPSPGSNIEVFAPGKKHPKLTMSGPFQPFMLALTRNQGRLFVADYGSGNNDGAVFVYAYPSGTLLFKDTQGTAAGAYGVALDPS
jgi:sugar lactone lactonase YvrE